MSRTGISYSQVELAAETILTEGKNPTIERVRQRLGSGSHSTITKYLNEWKNLRLRASAKEMPSLILPPDPVNRAVSQVWRQMQTESDLKIAQLQAEMEARVDAAIKEKKILLDENNKLQHSLNENKKELSMAKSEHDELVEQLIILQQTNKVMNEKVTLSESFLQDLKTETEHKLQCINVEKDKFISHLKLQLEEMRNDSESAMREQKDLNAKLSDQNTKLGKQLRCIDSEMKVAKSVCNKYREEMKRLDQKLKSIMLALNNAKKQTVKHEKALTSKVIESRMINKELVSERREKRALEKRIEKFIQKNSELKVLLSRVRP